MAQRGLVIAAPSSGAGKTTVTLALLAALSAKGQSVAGGKAGPDYIDPAFHAAACNAPSFTFDAWAMSAPDLRNRAASVEADLVIIEGAMGALDGAGLAARGSVADLAADLGLPLVLVIDAARQGASVALPVAGFQALRPDVTLAGVILNRLGSARHGNMATRAVEALGVPVLGCLPRMPELSLPERHLGLVQAGEHPDIAGFLTKAAAWVEHGVDLPALVQSAGLLPDSGGPAQTIPPLGQRIAVAQDAAFAFAYPHLLHDWRAAGAQLFPFSPLADEAPDPTADAVFLPGGYPELHAGRLSAAARFRDGMRITATRGAVVYGECGGYMALGDGLIDADGTQHRMLGLLPLETSFATRKLSLGYRRLSPLGGPFDQPLSGHEFHYAQVISEGTAPRLFSAKDADDTDLPPMGLRVQTVCGSFAHIISTAAGARPA